MDDCVTLPSTDDPATLELLAMKIPELLPDAIVVIDDEGRIVFINAATELLLGYGREEILGKSVEVLIPEASKEIHVQHRNRYMEEPRIRQMGAGMNLMARHKKGREFKVQIMLAPIMVPKTGLYALATIRRAS